MSRTDHERPPRRSSVTESVSTQELRARKRLWGVLADVGERVIVLLDLVIDQEKEERRA